MVKKATPKEKDIILYLLDQSYDKKAWHGTTLRGSLRGLDYKQALWRPARGRHNIWEIIVHCAYWEYIGRRRILEDEKLNFPIKGSDWFQIPSPADAKAWKQTLAFTRKEHIRLRKAIEHMPLSKIHYVPSRAKLRNSEILHGVANHNLYHAGQIQLIKRLMKVR